MIMIWNRREVFIGDSLKRFNDVCDIFSANRINYKYRVIDNTSPSLLGSSRRARTGTFGENIDNSKMYYIYVHKDDYDNAYNLSRK